MRKSGSQPASPSLQSVPVASAVSLGPHDTEPNVGSSQPSPSVLPEVISQVLPSSTSSFGVVRSVRATFLPM